jgi:hypothetical protein
MLEKMNSDSGSVNTCREKAISSICRLTAILCVFFLLHGLRVLLRRMPVSLL